MLNCGGYVSYRRVFGATFSCAGWSTAAQQWSRDTNCSRSVYMVATKSRCSLRLGVESLRPHERGRDVDRDLSVVSSNYILGAQLVCADECQLASYCSSMNSPNVGFEEKRIAQLLLRLCHHIRQTFSSARLIKFFPPCSRHSILSPYVSLLSILFEFVRCGLVSLKSLENATM